MDERVEHWLTENQVFENGISDLKLSVRVKQHLFSKRSQYQQVEVLDTWGMVVFCSLMESFKLQNVMSLYIMR